MKMQTKEIILSRLLPKTGQTEVKYAGDDGTFQAGWWLGTKSPNLRTRFISKTINGNDVVVDSATGLMWAADGNEAGCNNGDTAIWETCIDAALNLDFAGFTDWRLPNIRELCSIVDYIEVSPVVDTTIFPNTADGYYYSSTENIALAHFKWVIYFANGSVEFLDKSTELRMRSVRGGV